jgi:hypothetical protein
MGSSRIIGYGFDFTGEYFESNAIWGAEDVYELATETEVFEALKFEAIKRGFKDVVAFKNNNTEKAWTVSGNIELKYYDGSLMLWADNWQTISDGYVDNSRGCLCIFKQGVWATIIKEPTIKLNGEYTKVQLTDIINNRF